MRNRLLILALLAALLWTPDLHAQSAARAQLKTLSRSARIRYNRVEGLFVGYRLGLSPGAWQGVTLFGEGGFGIGNRDPRWEGGIEYRGKKGNLALALFDRTDTFDREIVRTGENSIFALLFKWDYRDYFRAKNGFEARGGFRPRRHLLLVGRLSAFEFVHMPVDTDISLFYPDRPFRINPRIQEGDAGLLQAGLVLDTRIRSPLFRNAWYAALLFERGFREFGFNGLLVKVKRHQQVPNSHQGFIFQAQLATRESTAEQFLFDLGGVSTLRGYEIKEFTGNRAVLFNFDYRFQGDIMGRIPIKGFHLLNLILFFDAGWVNAVPRSQSLLKGFGDMSLEDFKSNAGIGIALFRQIFRFNIARRLDRSDDAWVLSARLQRDF